MKNPQVSVIILMHNWAQMTLDCISAVKKHTKDIAYEVIIVNNGSKHTQRGILRKGLARYRKVPFRVFDFSDNVGFAKGANSGAKRARGEYLVFLNNDAIVSQNWLKPLIYLIIKNPKVAACQPKLRSYLNQKYFDYAGGAGGFLDIFGYPFARGRVFENVEKDTGQYDEESEIFWATGACFVVSKSKFWAVGGFDEYFFSYGEEVDLCISLRKIGYKVFCVPSSVVFHRGAKTSNQNLPLKILLIHHNHLYLMIKHYSIWPWFPLFLICFLFDGASILYYLWHMRFNFALAVIKAYWKMLIKFPDLVKAGVIEWSGKSLFEDKKIYKSSIVVNYFFLKQKNFNELMGIKS